MIVWNGMDLIILVILAVCGVVDIVLFLLCLIQDRINKYFERRNKND